MNRNPLVMSLIILIGSSVTGCTTYSRSQCENFDWQNRGYNSALKGQSTPEGLAHYQKECAEVHEVVPNTVEFEKGYKKGNQIFCTGDYAEKFGLKGGEYRSGICGEESEKAFLKPYIKGINVYYKNRVSELEYQVADLESEVSDLESKVSSLESEVNSCEPE